MFGRLTGPIYYGRSCDGETSAPRVGIQELRAATEHRRRLSEILFAECSKVGRRSKTVIRSDLGDTLIRIANLVKDTFGDGNTSPADKRYCRKRDAESDSGSRRSPCPGREAPAHYPIEGTGG